MVWSHDYKVCGERGKWCPSGAFDEVKSDPNESCRARCARVVTTTPRCVCESLPKQAAGCSDSKAGCAD